MKKKSIALILITAIFFCGCAEGGVSDIPPHTEQILSETKTETEEIVSKNEEKEPHEIVSLPAPENKEHPPSPEKEISVSEFTGIPLSDNPHESSNLNSKTWGYNPICFDSGKVYFSNLRDRQYLYVFDGEKSKCLAKIPANSLNYYDGKIYFISNGKVVNPDDMNQEGFIFRYDTKSEELSRLTDYYISHSLYVNSEGIFYVHPDVNKKSTVYRLDEGTGEIIPLYKGFRIINYNGFHYNLLLDYHSDGLCINYLCLSDNENNYVLNTPSDVIGYPTMECIDNGKFFFRKQGVKSLTSIELKDGTVFEYPVSKFEYGISDYTLFKDTLYVSFGDGMRCFQDGKFVEYINKEPLYLIEKLFSGADCIYALINGMDGPNDWDLAEVVFSTDEEGNPAYGFNRIT